MKVISSKRATLDSCISDSQYDRVVITRDGKPVALIVGIEGMDKEQLELGTSDKFWKLIRERRTQRKLTRAELEQRVNKGKITNDRLPRTPKRA